MDAVKEHDISPLDRPKIDVDQMISGKTPDETLKLTATVEVQPQIAVPDLSTIEITVEAKSPSKKLIDEKIEAIRAQFASLVGVNRPAEIGDYVSLDMTATDLESGETIDSLNGVSYKVGEKNMLTGIDEVLVGMKKDDEKEFETTLEGTHAGKNAKVYVKVLSVKEQELPEIDDELAKISSEFNTLEELKDDLKKQVEADILREQSNEAQVGAVNKLVEIIDIPVPEDLLESGVKSEMEREENAIKDAANAAAGAGNSGAGNSGAEAVGAGSGSGAGASSGNSGEGGAGSDSSVGTNQPQKRSEQEIKSALTGELQRDLLISQLSKDLKIEVSQNDVMDYVANIARMYGMKPDDMLKFMVQQGQVEMVYGELTRIKTITELVQKINIVDTAGNKIDISKVFKKSAS
jgi:trigger factor